MTSRRCSVSRSHNWLLVFLRVSAFLFVLPFFSATNFPVTCAWRWALQPCCYRPCCPHFRSGSSWVLSSCS